MVDVVIWTPRWCLRARSSPSTVAWGSYEWKMGIFTTLGMIADRAGFMALLWRCWAVGSSLGRGVGLRAMMFMKDSLRWWFYPLSDDRNSQTGVSKTWFLKCSLLPSMERI